ncbi:MAG TPA: sodium:solute symporter family protein [Candidatus Methylacidiphilales bacterium]
MTSPLFLATAQPLLSLNGVDFFIIAVYFAFVLGIGFYLKKFAKTGDDFFMAGREMTAWVAGLAFVSANLGALELMGWSGATYQYGILCAHWYWIGAIPAMIFLALVMMPFYYISKTHSVPGYLALRFGSGAHALSAISFGLMTLLMSGVDMYAMALVMKTILGWNIHFSIWVAAVTVGIYVGLGGLLSAIFNEVLQFALIWIGALAIPVLGLIECGGWDGMLARIHQNFPSQDFTHLWSNLGSPADNPMGIQWFAIVFGLGSVLAMGYWTTDFLVVQRVLTAKDLRSAKMAPIIGAGFKMFVPIIVILPGLVALAVLPQAGIELHGEDYVKDHGGHSYNELLPLMLGRYCGPGLLGLGITALMAGFMSGMAGNVSAFSTIWTYDIYRTFLNRKATDAQNISMGRVCTIVGILISIATAYAVMQFGSIMDYVQALFSFFIAPLFGTVVLGMLWKRTTSAGGFWGLLCGIGTAIGLWAWVKADPSALRYVTFSADSKMMAENMFRAAWSGCVCVAVTVVVSLLTTPRPEGELVGLVKSCTAIPDEGEVPLVHKPVFWAVVVGIVFIALNIYFW